MSGTCKWVTTAPTEVLSVLYVQDKQDNAFNIQVFFEEDLSFSVAQYKKCSLILKDFSKILLIYIQFRKSCLRHNRYLYDTIFLLMCNPQNYVTTISFQSNGDTLQKGDMPEMRLVRTIEFKMQECLFIAELQICDVGWSQWPFK